MTDLRKAAAALLSAVDLALPYAPHRHEFDRVSDTADDLRAALAAEQAPDAVAAERDRWETAIGAVMPPDFKDWHANSPSERPAVAAWVISNLREREDELSRLLEKHNALALNAAKLRTEVEALRDQVAQARDGRDLAIGLCREAQVLCLDYQHDAARYRWLRDQAVQEVQFDHDAREATICVCVPCDWDDEPPLDEAIDAVMTRAQMGE